MTISSWGISVSLDWTACVAIVLRLLLVQRAGKVSVMEADGRFHQLLIGQRVGPSILVVAILAGKVERQVWLSKGTLFGELRCRMGVDGHEVGADIATELLGIPQRALGDSRHVAVHTLGMANVCDLLVDLVLKVAILAGCLDAQPFRILNRLMRIVAVDAAHDTLLGLEEFFILFVMLDEAALGVDLGHITANVALTA